MKLKQTHTKHSSQQRE